MDTTRKESLRKRAKQHSARFAACLLCVMLAVCLAACGKTSASPSSTATQSTPTDGGAQEVNPLVEQPDWASLNAALDIPLAAPAWVENKKYHVLAQETAQITFSPANNTGQYTLRGSRRTNTAGVYGTPVIGTPLVILAGDAVTKVSEKIYTSDTVVYEWSWGEYYYSLVTAPSDDPGHTNSSSIAALCAQITANASSAKEPKAYAQETHEARGAQQNLAQYTMTSYEEIDKSTLTPQTLLGEFSLEQRDIYGTPTTTETNSQRITLYNALKNDPSSLLVRMEFDQRSKNGDTRQVEVYDLLQKSENGNYYIHSTIS